MKIWIRFQERNLEWFPRMRTSSLDMREEKNKEDQDNRLFRVQIDAANRAILNLTTELSELQKMVEKILSFFLLFPENVFLSFL